MTEYRAVSGKGNDLLLAYMTHTFDDAKANEYAHHGFSRRLMTAVRCIENIFEILPLNQDNIPTREELDDAIINLQAFVFNAFGCIDNLAWVWVKEKGTTKNEGSPFPKEWVGLGMKNRAVRSSFSREFQRHLEGMDEWMAYLEEYRHALAHRIPLYVPPFQIATDLVGTYQELELDKMEALKRHEFEDHDRMSTEQDALRVFSPIMTHSFGEQAKPIAFHPQLICDFMTIEELGREFLQELDR